MNDRVRTNGGPDKAEWEELFESEQETLADMPPLTLSGFGYRWRRLKARIYYLRWGIRMAVESPPPWVGAKERSGGR